MGCGVSGECGKERKRATAAALDGTVGNGLGGGKGERRASGTDRGTEGEGGDRPRLLAASSSLGQRREET